MGRKQRVYSRVTEAADMIKQLCEKHSDAFWCVNPESIVVMGVENVTRSDSAIEKTPLYSKLKQVKGVEQALFKENNIKERYIIEVFWNEWNDWRESIKLAVLSRRLFEISPEVDKKHSPDCVGFKILYKALGVNWERDDGNGIPNLLLSDVEFDLDLRPGLEGLEDLEDEPED